MSNDITVEGTEGMSPQRSSKCNIDRAKPRKSPHRPLPGIVTGILARNSSESDDSESEITAGSCMIDEDTEISFENLQEFCDTVPQEIKDKKRLKAKKNGKKQQRKKIEKGMNIYFPNSELSFVMR